MATITFYLKIFACLDGKKLQKFSGHTDAGEGEQYYGDTVLVRHRPIPPLASLEKHPKNLLEGFMETQVNTLVVVDKFLVSCGLQGELIIKYLNKPTVCFYSRLTYDNDGIATAIEITSTISGANHFIGSNYDSGVRDFDLEKF
ncbi:hypothetical protein H5410_041433 [Solanum commersonii]|uniref:Uncharacterized protein n=1 Tax=Solanum commersonii TaxID=4109 RepID=A0A9J5XTL4_SOLCO|nr:hypothetical protein H5410_041433 [Solanum commersonii]